jgi:20S proteasome subunit alpha 6
MEAVKQGSCTVGLRSKDFAVLVALKRSPSDLASFQKKIIKIDAHVGAAFSGLTSDARVLGYFLVDVETL